jgi:hypothetical protein
VGGSVKDIAEENRTNDEARNIRAGRTAAQRGDPQDRRDGKDRIGREAENKAGPPDQELDEDNGKCQQAGVEGVQSARRVTTF